MKNEKNKKNKKALLTVLSALLAITVAALSVSLARYIATNTASDDAVSASFGFDIPNTVDLFSDSYTNVKANAEGKKIIAPGTTGQFAFNVMGAAEVSYEVSANVTVEYSDDWNDYEPLEFSIDGDDWTDFSEFQDNLSEALSSEVMPPNSAYTNTETIYWRWPFFVSNEFDEKDSVIGALAANGTAPGVSVSIEVTAVQID